MNKRSLYNELVAIITAVTITLSLLLSLVYLKSFRDYSYKNFSDQANTILSAIHSFIEHFLTESEMQLLFINGLIENNPDDSKELIDMYFKFPGQQKNYLTEYKIINSEGKITDIFPFNEEEIGTDVSSQLYFKEGVQAGDINWSHAILSSNEYNPVLNVTMPLHNGLIAAEMTFLPMLHEIEKIYTSDFGNIGVVDANGMYILHSKIELVKERVFSPFKLPENSTDMHHSGSIEISGKKYFYALMPLEEISGNIVFYQSFDYFRQIEKTITLKLLMITVSIFIFFLVIAIFAIKLITKPITLMQSRIELIAKGDFTNQIMNPTYTEFQSLFNSVNTMSIKIAEEQSSLKAALQTAEDANNVKTQFLANMSHELRTPLNGIFGMASLLRGTELDEAQKKYLEYLKTSAENLLGIIEDLLFISRIESGKLALNPEPVLIREVFNYTLKQMENDAAVKNIHFIYEFETPEEYIMLDKIKVNQIIVNLLTNAIKFTMKGYVKFIARKENQLLMLEVFDTGIGIDKKNQQKIFQSFVQLEDTFSKNYQGLGLGLAITNNLVELHGGKIELQSTPGSGSHFKVILPYLTK